MIQRANDLSTREMDVLRRARELTFCRSDLQSLASRLSELDNAVRATDRLLAHCVSELDDAGFSNIFFAALVAGIRVDARHLVEGGGFFPEATHLASAVLHSAGDVAHYVVEAVRAGKMGTERESVALLAAAYWCRESKGISAPRELVASARVLARKATWNPIVQIQLRALADIVHDAGLREDVGGTRAASYDALSVRRILLDEARDSVLHHVEEESEVHVQSGFTVRRAVARIGRNDPCPCGSGKKYKKCCIEKDKKRLERSSSVAGVTLDELRERPEKHLTQERLDGMRSHELARLDPSLVPRHLIPVLARRLGIFNEYEAVVRVFEKVGVTIELEGFWHDALFELRRSGRRDLVQRLCRLRDEKDLDHSELDLGSRLLLCSDPAEQLPLMEAEAVKILDGEQVDVVEMAYALLESEYPGLGVLVARSALSLGRSFDSLTLLEALLETRVRIGMDPDDPIESVLDAQYMDDRQAEESEALSDALGRLARKDGEMKRLKDELESIQARLEKESRAERAEPPLAQEVDGSERSHTGNGEGRPAIAPAASEAEIDELRGRLAKLKGELKARHGERNDLRRELRDARREMERLREKAAQVEQHSSNEDREDEDHLLDEQQSMGKQPVRVPRTAKRFGDDLGKAPRPVARAVLRLIGRLAAGEDDAFRGVRRLKLNHAILRQRVGTHRLLFRLEEGELEVVALLHRRDLERTVQKLAAR